LPAPQSVHHWGFTLTPAGKSVNENPGRASGGTCLDPAGRAGNAEEFEWAADSPEGIRFRRLRPVNGTRVVKGRGNARRPKPRRLPVIDSVHGRPGTAADIGFTLHTS